MTPSHSSPKLWRRRDLIKLLGVTAIAGPAIFRGTTAKAAASKVIKIGHVSPQTGALAPFAEADSFVLDQIRTVLAKGITNGSVTFSLFGTPLKPTKWLALFFRTMETATPGVTLSSGFLLFSKKPVIS